MTTEAVDDTPIPALMRAARGTYAQAIQSELEAIGVDDLPRNGTYVLFSTLTDDEDGSRERRPSLRAQLGISKQAVSQLVEILVQRGYLVRSGDPEDGRRVALDLTERGREVTEAVVRACDAVDAELAATVSPSELLAFRKALVALNQIKTSRVERGEGKRRPSRRGPRFEPIFPVRDLAASMAHYERLGFKTHAFDDGYGFANRQGISIHLAVHADHDAASNRTETYLKVRDAEAIHAAWSAPGLGGETRPVEDTPWGMREGSHSDPDGNLIRFGSPIGA